MARAQPVHVEYPVEYILAVLVLILAGWFYLWTATSAGSPFSTKLQQDDLYNRLSDGFLAGQLSFIEKPNPALADLQDPWDPAQNAGLSTFHDVSYFHGKYYLYFGAAPAVLLLAPWKALTGTYLGENVAAAVFSWLGALSSIGLVLVLRRRHFPALAGWVGGLCLVALALGNFAPILLRRPVYYELAISSAYAFAMTALLFVALAQVEGRRRRLWLALAGLAYGLTLASRPNYLFGAVVLLVPFIPAWRAWRTGDAPDIRRIKADLIAVGAPLALVATLLLVYNALRFGSPLEFGTYYMISGLHPQHQAITSAGYLPTNLWFYFLAPAQLSAYFPFFEVIHMPWFALPAGYTGEEDAYGLCNAPFYLMALFVAASWRDPRLPAPASLRAFALGSLALAACNLFVLGRVGGAANRYMVDIFPSLLPLACLGVFWAEHSAARGYRKVALRAAWIAALAYTAAFNVFVSLQHNDLLEHYNPAAYRRLAHAFNHVSSWLGETSPSRTGPLRLRLRFPVGQTGHLEPLVVTGLSFKADFIYLFYADAGHVQVGFEHTSYGGALTKPPVQTDYGAEHTVEIEMGSLYPPVEHPYFDGMAPAEVARLKRTLRVVLDGREVLSGDYSFYDSSPGDVSVGRNPVSSAFGKRFTGTGARHISRRWQQGALNPCESASSAGDSGAGDGAANPAPAAGNRNRPAGEGAGLWPPSEHPQQRRAPRRPLL